MLNKLKDALAATRHVVEQVTSEHMIPESMKTTAAQQQERYDICKACDELHLRSNKCRVCGCFMGVKTWLKRESCPKGKWGKIPTVSVE